MMQTITVAAHASGPRQIEAEIHGPFAIHATLEGGNFTVTHLFTGFAVTTSARNLDEARTAAKELNRLGNWYFGWLDIEREYFSALGLRESVNWLQANDLR